MTSSEASVTSDRKGATWWSSLAQVVSERPAAVSGVLLLVATAAAMLWANSGAAASYHALWETKFTLGFEGFGLSKALILWINDLLMAVFFLLVGLEIKRELAEGELSSVKRAALPVAAATGGVIVPALIYWILNRAPGGVPAGWAIPAATDIAFALGILALLGSRVPLAVKVFLTTVAVFDDLAAITIIAAFFTNSLNLAALGVALLAMVALVALNRSGVRIPLPYALFGVVLWLGLLASGVHATLAGVLLAFTIPMDRAADSDEFYGHVRKLIAPLQREAASGLAPDNIVHRVRSACNRFESPLVTWEHAIQPLVLFAIVPLFALANAGVTLSADVGPSAAPVAGGVGLGLILGKPLGITLFSWVAVKLRWATLPQSLSWPQLHAASWLAGIGFTMSLFISGLALQGAAQTAARIGLLAASALAASIGTILLWRTCPPLRVPNPGSQRSASEQSPVPHATAPSG